MHWWPDQFKLASMALTMALAGIGLGVVIAPIGETAIRAAGRDSYGVALRAGRCWRGCSA